MAAPTVRVFVDFLSQTAFEDNPLVLGNALAGKLGTGKLGAGILPIEVTSSVEKISIRRGRSRLTSSFEAGTMDVTLYDETGDWNPSNPSSIYYPNVLPLKRITVYATYQGTDYYLFSGWIQTYDLNFYRGQDNLNRVVLKCVDSFGLFAQASITTVAGGGVAQDTGTRINAILDAIKYPLSLREIDTGVKTLQADPGTSRTGLEALQTAELSEFGGLYLDGQSKVNFINRTNCLKTYANPLYTFADDGSGITYQDGALQYDDTLLINSVTVTRLGGVAQTVTDTASITQYFIHSGERKDILVQTDAEAKDQAETILYSRKTPKARIDSIKLNLYDDTNPLKPKAGVDLELLDAVTVKKDMPQGSKFNQGSVIIGIHHDITKTTHITTFFTSEPLLVGFVLDSTLNGILGTDILN